MWRVLKGLAWLLACALLVLAAAFAWGRLRPPTETQAQALDVLHQDLRPTQGRNAFPLLWLVNFDVPLDQMDAVYAKELQRATTWLASRPNSSAVEGSVMPGPQVAFPKLPYLTSEEKAMLCSTRDSDCLGKVRAHRDDVRAVLVRQSLRLAHDEALSETDYEWNDMPVSMLAGFPSYGSSMGLWESATALDFVDGRSSQAMQRACSNVMTMRRLHARNNTLLGSMIFAARLQGAVHLFSQMLGELPANEVLPGSCTQAFAPVVEADVDMCAIGQTEFAFASAVASDMQKDEEQWYNRWKWSVQGIQRLWATKYGALCKQVTRAELLADSPITLAGAIENPDVFDWISNPAGVMLTRMGLASFDEYLNRQQDVAASLRLGATVLWLRQTRGAAIPLNERLAQRPAWMRVADDRQLRVSLDGRTMSMNFRSKRSDWPATWPLPAGL
ncbi:hypothetical protein [Dyella sp. 20L07]|uniref:hypothetical protein n=1 Tax=Dyella sp. 20L07 TaxID=3384240 RepID=UPI003D28FF9C